MSARSRLRRGRRRAALLRRHAHAGHRAWWRRHAANAGVDALLSGVPLALRTARDGDVGRLPRARLARRHAEDDGAVEEAALALLRAKARRDGVGVLWHGCNWRARDAVAPTRGLPFNALDATLLLPPPDVGAAAAPLGALAVAACASDCCSNALRVLKTARVGADLDLVRRGGAAGAREGGAARAACRGLSTRLLVNGVQCSPSRRVEAAAGAHGWVM